MAGLVPPARRKPLRRGEGLGINVFPSMPNDLDGRNKPGHDGLETDGRQTPIAICNRTSAHGQGQMPSQRLKRASSLASSPRTSLGCPACSTTCTAHTEEAFVTNQLSDDLTIVNLATSTPVATIPIGGKPAGVAVAADGRFAYVASPDDKAVSVVDAAERKVVGRIEVGGGPLGIAVTPDGATVYVADWYNAAIRIIDAKTRAVTASIAVGASPSGLAVTPDGKLLLSADRDDDMVSVIDTATQTRLKTIKVGTRPFGVTIDGDGQRAYTANVGSNDVSVIDLAEAREVGRIKTGLRPYAVALAQGKGFVTDQYDGTVTVFDVASLQPLTRITVGDYPEGIAATADGRRIIVANWESNILSVIDVATLKVTGEIKVGNGPRAFGSFLRR